MSQTEPLEAFFERSSRFAKLHDAYLERGVDQSLDEADKEMEGSLEHYFQVGADAVRVCVQALVQSGRTAPRRILDFPSGSGRVTRHFAAFFPDAEIVACDLYPEHVEFCVSNFGVEGVISEQDFDSMTFGAGGFDLIFCGSLLTHLPERRTRSAIALIVRSLSADGVAVLTVHGRQSIEIQRNEVEYLPHDRFRRIERAFDRSGYGFSDYADDFRSRFTRNSSYGISVCTPSWTMGVLEAFDDIRIVGYAERAWDRHQDVVVIGRPSAFQP